MTKREQIQQQVQELYNRYKGKLTSALVKAFASIYRRHKKLGERLEVYKQTIRTIMLREEENEVEMAGVKLQLRYQNRFEVNPAKLKEVDPALYELLLEPSTTRLKKMVDKGQIPLSHLKKLTESGAVIIKEVPQLVVKEL